MWKRKPIVTAVLSFVTLGLAAACSNNDAVGPSVSTLSRAPGTGGTDTTDVPLPGPRTGPGPVVSVQLTPGSASVSVGATVYFWARGFNADGELVEGTQATWTSSDPAVAVVCDTGSVRGVAVGVAQITATMDGHSTSAQITVDEALPPITQFDLTLGVRGAIVGSDTTETEPVQGATVALYSRAPSGSGSTDADVLLGTAVTDALGEVSFQDVPVGWLRAVITPAAGSPYQATSTTFSAPALPEVHLELYLRRGS